VQILLDAGYKTVMVTDESEAEFWCYERRTYSDI